METLTSPPKSFVTKVASFINYFQKKSRKKSIYGGYFFLMPQ